MKLTIKIILVVAIILSSAVLSAQPKNRWASARYQPVSAFLAADSTLSKWFKQYVDTSAGKLTFKDFLKKLSQSEPLWQRSKRAGLAHNQLYSPIVTLQGKDFKVLERMSEQDKANIRLAMLELDIALAAIDATLPDTAHEEFRREVLRGAKPLTEVAKLPMSAVEAMTFTIMSHKVSDRINELPPQKIPPEQGPLPVDNPSLENPYAPW